MDATTRAAVIGGLSAFAVAFIAPAFATGGRDSRMRRRLLQELEVLGLLVEQTPGHEALRALIEGHVAEYVVSHDGNADARKREWIRRQVTLFAVTVLLPVPVALLSFAVRLFSPQLSAFVWVLGSYAFVTLFGFALGTTIFGWARDRRKDRARARRELDVILLGQWQAAKRYPPPTGAEVTPY